MEMTQKIKEFLVSITVCFGFLMVLYVLVILFSVDDVHGYMLSVALLPLALIAVCSSFVSFFIRSFLVKYLSALALSIFAFSLLVFL